MDAVDTCYRFLTTLR